MGAKSILFRYLVRTREHLPLDPLELREHLASVAERDGLKVTEEELDELIPRLPEIEIGEPLINPPVGDPAIYPKREMIGVMPVNEMQGKQARKSRRGSKGGDSTKKEI